MNHKPRIFAFAGSARKDSLNRRLLLEAVEAARRAGAEVDLVDLAEFPLPLYDGDLEEQHGVPAAALELRRRMSEAQALLIASPEYNSSYSALLKNTIDWVSRPVAGAPPLAAFAGKWAALVSASPSQFGGIRGLTALRTLLENMRVQVLPGQVALGTAHEQFDGKGRLVDAEQRESLSRLAHELVSSLGAAAAA